MNKQLNLKSLATYPHCTSCDYRITTQAEADTLLLVQHTPLLGIYQCPNCGKHSIKVTFSSAISEHGRASRDLEGVNLYEGTTYIKKGEDCPLCLKYDVEIDNPKRVYATDPEKIKLKGWFREDDTNAHGNLVKCDHLVTRTHMNALITSVRELESALRRHRRMLALYKKAFNAN